MKEDRRKRNCANIFAISGVIIRAVFSQVTADVLRTVRVVCASLALCAVASELPAEYNSLIAERYVFP